MGAGTNKRRKKSVLDRMEKKFGKYAIKDLMKYLSIIYFAGFILNLVSSIKGIDIYYSFLSLDLDAIMHGQVWRIVTFIFAPVADTAGGNMLFAVLILVINIAFNLFMGRALENEWGTFRFNVYVFSGLLAIMIGSLLTQGVFMLLGFGDFNMINLCAQYGETETTCINLMILLAFATIHAEEKILLYFIIPIKIKWIAILLVLYKGYIFVTLVYSVIVALIKGSKLIALGEFTIIMMMLFSAINFLVFFISSRKNSRTLKRKKKNASKMNNFTVISNKTRHKCSVCGKTEKDDENLEFRYCSRCQGNHEYCMEHLFTHEHVQKLVIDINKKTKDE